MDRSGPIEVSGNGTASSITALGSRLLRCIIPMRLTRILLIHGRNSGCRSNSRIFLYAANSASWTAFSASGGWPVIKNRKPV